MKDLYIVRTKRGWKIVDPTKELKKKQKPVGAEPLPCLCHFSKKDQKKLRTIGKGIIQEEDAYDSNEDDEEPSAGSLLGSVNKLIKTGKEKIQQGQKFVEHVIHGRHDEYPPNAKKVLDANGEAKVEHLELHRLVLPEIYNSIMNVWTKGEIAKRLKEQPKDKLFHISMWAKLSNGKTIRIEKNAVINLEENPSKSKEEETQSVSTPNTTLTELLEKTRKQVGDKDFFSYSAKDNNCGNFIEFILKANGLSSPDTHAFIGQNTQEILDGFPSLRKTLNTVTDLAGKADVVLQGGALSTKDLKDLLGASYNPKDNVNDFKLDREISSSTSQVYHNPKTGQVVVAHRGTKGVLDWGNNLVYAIAGKKGYKMTPRFKEAQKVQREAQKKYGAENVSTIGHSQAGLQAELLGHKSKEIITVNKATRPFTSQKKENQYDIRTTGDIVSALNPFQRKNKKEIEIQSKTKNPLAEHSLETLEGDQMVGGTIDWEHMKWGSFTEQFKRYKQDHPDIDMKEFAKEIVSNPEKYKPRTVKRARFYLNVLRKKKSPDNIMIRGRGHPALASDRFPRTPQSFMQVHGKTQTQIGSGLYASGMSGGRFSVNLAPEADYFSKRFEYMGKGFKGDFTKGVEYMGSGFPFKEVKYGTRPVVRPRPTPRPKEEQNDSESDEEKRPVLRGGRLKKGSPEAKAFMASIRRKKGSKGGRIPAPHSRSYITDPSLLG